MRVIVCGGRDFDERERLFEALDALHTATPFTTVVHGGAPGADTLAGQWAAARGVAVIVFPADWERLHSKAGSVRNQQMADRGADACIAFPGGRGTADMIRRAKRAAIPVIEALG